MVACDGLSVKMLQSYISSYYYRLVASVILRWSLRVQLYSEYICAANVVKLVFGLVCVVPSLGSMDLGVIRFDKSWVGACWFVGFEAASPE